MFCWKVVDLCCPVYPSTSIELLSWLYEFSCVISKLGGIFESYCKSYKIPSGGQQLKIDCGFSEEAKRYIAIMPVTSD